MWECNRLGNWKAGDGDWLQAWQDSETEQHLLTSLFPSSLPDFILLPAPSRLPLALSWYFPENAHSWGSLRWLGSNTHPWACHWGQGKGMFQLVYRTSPPPPPDSSTLPPPPGSGPLCLAPSAPASPWLAVPSLPSGPNQGLPWLPLHPLVTLLAVSLHGCIPAWCCYIVTWYVFELFVSFQGNHEGCLQLSPASTIYQVS